MNTDTRDDDIRTALHDLARSIALTGSEDPVSAVHARTETRHRRSPWPRALAAAALVALLIGVVGVLATRDGDDPPDVATDPTPTTADLPSIDAPAGMDPEATIALRAGSAWARPGTDIAFTVHNWSGDRVLYGPMLHVSRWDGVDWIPVADAVGTEATFQEWQEPNTVVFDYSATVVEPFAPAAPVSLRLPGDLEPGHYRVVLYEGAREPVDGGDREAFDIEGRFEVIAPDGYAYESSQFGPLPIERIVLPDDIVVLDDGRVAIRFTTSCNQPAQEIGFTTNGDAALVEVRVGSFMVIDCVGEPSDWSVVLDPPVDLAGKQVISADDLGNRRAVTTGVASGEVLFEDDRDLGVASAPALVFGAFDRPTFPSAFSPAPACSNIVYVARVETAAGTFLEVRDAGSPGADCVAQPGWVPLQRFVSSPDEAPLALPDVVGLSEADATATLSELGFQVDVVYDLGAGDAAGRVVAQDPAPASSVAPASTIVLTVAAVD